ERESVLQGREALGGHRRPDRRGQVQPGGPQPTDVPVRAVAVRRRPRPRRPPGRRAPVRRPGARDRVPRLPPAPRLREGAAGGVLLPVLYPGSHAHNDPNVKLARATDWRDLPGGAMLGSGVRTFILEREGGESDEDVVTLLDLRELTFPVAETPEGAEGAA